MRDNEILLRWILSGPAGSIEVYAPVIIEDGLLKAPRAEIHRHAFTPTPESSEAQRHDCDLMPSRVCYFQRWWGAAAAKAWKRSDDDIWQFLRFAYGREFNVEMPEEPEWLR